MFSMFSMSPHNNSCWELVYFWGIHTFPPPSSLSGACANGSHTEQFPFWRKTFQLHPVHLFLFSEIHPQNPHAHSFWGEAFSVWPVQLFLHSTFYSKTPHANAHWWEALCLWPLQLHVHQSLFPQDTRAEETSCKEQVKEQFKTQDNMHFLQRQTFKEGI